MGRVITNRLTWLDLITRAWDGQSLRTACGRLQIYGLKSNRDACALHQCSPRSGLLTPQYSRPGTDGFINNWNTMVSHDMLSEMFVRVFEICKKLLFPSWQLRGKTHFALEPTRWTVWTVIIAMETKEKVQRRWFFFPIFTCIIFSLYIQCFGFQILCSKRAAARHTRSKEKKPTAFQCENLNITVPARRVKKSQFVCQVGHGLSHIA